MTELAQTWHAWFRKQKPRRRKHHMRERRKFEARYRGTTAYRRWPVGFTWATLEQWAARGLAAQQEA